MRQFEYGTLHSMNTFERNEIHSKTITPPEIKSGRVLKSYAAVMGAYLPEASILSITASGDISPPMTISNTDGV